MRELRYALISLALVSIIIASMLFAMNNTYDKSELKMFNKLNHTAYSYEEWRLYEYDIKKLHPFNPEASR